uniref:Flavodoxin-like domain-containing protein n=1 Tax=Setaria viridis TaxID=4556 RepID=A0A4U6TC55_SETVI|nr:hypothetical protein SEVIR_8G011500v2 [Setaria viridis]
MDAASAGLKPSALDLLVALLTGRGPHWASSLTEDCHLLVLLATSLAVLVGCCVTLLAQTRPFAVKPKDEPDPDDGRQRVTVFFETQTSTAESFAKALAEEAKVRYGRAVFKVVDLVCSTDSILMLLLKISCL